MTTLKLIENKALIEGLLRLAKSERGNQVEILRHLDELDKRQLYLELGYGSLWNYCRRALKFSEGTSQRRVLVARASRTYPALLTLLEDGRLTLCTTADLVPLLTEGNCEEMLAKAAGKSRQEVQRLGVPEKAKPVQRDVIRRIPKKADRGLAFAESPETASAPVAAVAQKAGESEPSKPADSEPACHRISFTASDEVVKKLELLKDLLGGASLAEVVERASNLLLDQVDPVRRHERREKKAKARAERQVKIPRPQAKPKATQPRRPPVALKDKVKAESHRQCAFVSRDGVRCTETRFLSIDHAQPYALGGSSTDISNLRCYCLAHNLHAGRKTFGLTITGDSDHPRQVPRQAM